MVIIFFEVKVNVQKGPLMFKDKVDRRCVSFIQLMFSSFFFGHMVIVLNDKHVRSC